MGEYGAVGSGGGGGGGGRGEGNAFADVTDSVMNSLADLADRVIALPPEILLLMFAAFLIGGLMVFRRV